MPNYLDPNINVDRGRLAFAAEHGTPEQRAEAKAQLKEWADAHPKVKKPVTSEGAQD